MNTGLSDAFNLIWRVHFATHFAGLPLETQNDLLGSYDIERRATATEVVDVASKLVRSTKDKAKSYVDLIEKNAGFITGMGVQYAGLQSPLVMESERGIFKAGSRCPDLWLQDFATNDTKRLYQNIVYGKYMILSIIGNVDVPVIEVKDTAFLTVMCLKPLEAMRVGVAKVQRGVGVQAELPKAYGCSWVKEGNNFAVLVRPDCYIEHVDEHNIVVDHIKRRFPGILT